MILLRKFNHTILIIVITFFTLNASAQEMWGISNSNFSGNMGIFLNPTTIVGAPYQYEINLVAFDVFAENANVYSLQNDKAVFHGLTGSIQKFSEYSETNLQNTFQHTLVIGPSYIRNRDKYAWGIHTAFRSEFSATDVSPHFAEHVYGNFQTVTPGQRYSLPEFSSAYATWLELGGSYGRVWRENERNVIKWGVNVNGLLGLSGYYIDSRSFDYTTIDSTSIIVHNADAVIGEASNSKDESIFGIHGAGLSTTLGITYIKGINRGAFDCNMSNDRQRKYTYRLSASLIDLGIINYFNNKRVNTIATSTDALWNNVDSLGTTSLRGVDTKLVTNIGGTIEDKSFNIWLPLALSVQFDYQVIQNLFANLSTVNRFHFATNQIARGNQVNVSARYERRRFESTLSFSMFEYETPSLGLGLRYRFFVIGTDRLLSTLGLSDDNNYNVFFGLKFQFCKKPFSKGPDCPGISN